MLNKIRQQPHIYYFYAYAASFIGYGAIMNSLGPIIPYLSADSGIIQTQYTFLFSARSLGMLTGAFLIKYLQNRQNPLSNHKLLIISSFLLLLLSSFFALSQSLFFKGFWMFFSSICYTTFQIIVSICVMMINPASQIQFWMLLTHGAFGVGGLIGPIIVYLFQNNAYYALGIMLACVIPAYIVLKTPEQCGFNQGGKQEHVKGKVVPFKIQILMGFTLFVYVGLQTSYGGWISSYSVLSQVATKEQATSLATIFWICITIFRFLFAFIPGTTTQKLKWLSQGCIATGIVAIFMVNIGYASFACYASAICFGISMSSLYPLVLSVCNEYGYSLGETQASNIISGGVVAEGILTMMVGLLMQWIHIDMFFYSLIIMSAVIWINRYFIVDFFVSNKQAKDMQVQLLDQGKNISN